MSVMTGVLGGRCSAHLFDPIGASRKSSAQPVRPSRKPPAMGRSPICSTPSGRTSSPKFAASSIWPIGARASPMGVCSPLISSSAGPKILCREALPARGAIEVKPTSADAFVTAGGEQVSRYWKAYGQVLVTNYRDFVLVGRNREGRAEDDRALPPGPRTVSLLELAFTPRAALKDHGADFLEFLRRVMLNAAALVEPRDVAWFLPSRPAWPSTDSKGAQDET